MRSSAKKKLVSSPALPVLDDQEIMQLLADGERLRRQIGEEVASLRKITESDMALRLG